MKLSAQVMTETGHYAKPIQVEGFTFKTCYEKLAEAFDKLPDELEGAKLLDWTEMVIRVRRN